MYGLSGKKYHSPSEIPRPTREEVKKYVDATSSNPDEMADQMDRSGDERRINLDPEKHFDTLYEGGDDVHPSDLPPGTNIVSEDEAERSEERMRRHLDETASIDGKV